MERHSFERKKKETKPVLAICYDFDKTLSPYDMQAQGYIQSVGYSYDVEKFWAESNERAERHNMDQNIAYMYKMIEEAAGKFAFNRETLMDYGSRVQLFPGVEDWFERIRDYGAKKDVIVEHYIISAGILEMIEGTSIARKGVFEKIYASSFYFNEKGEAKWPAQVVNFTNKTQFLFRIEKGVLDVNDPGVNESFAPEDIRVPFRNMIYIGDSDTDVPCMRLVNSYGGHSIGVYDPRTGDRSKVNKMMREDRIKYYTPADYSEGTELDRLVKAIIDHTAAAEILENIHYGCRRATAEADLLSGKDQRRKKDLINALDNSRSFAATHTLMRELLEITSWSDSEKTELFDIAVRNSQVYYILSDEDVSAFYSSILPSIPTTQTVARIREKMLEG